MTIIKDLNIENLIDFNKNKIELKLEKKDILNLKTGSEKKLYWICRICKISYLTQIKGKIKKDTDCKKCGHLKRINTVNLKVNEKQLNYIDNIENLIDFEKNKSEFNFDKKFILNLTYGSERQIYWICRLCKISYKAYIKDKIKDDSDCKACGIIKSKITNIEKYGYENPFANNEIKEKIKNTNLEKYGCENPFANNEIKEKIKNTNLEHLGCKYPMQNKNVQEKSKNVCIEKYGFENVFQNEEIKQKSKETCIIKYNCEYANQNEDIKNKIKASNLIIYGFEHAMQNSEIAEKCNSFGNKNKLYTLPSNNIIRLQGYEPLALDILLKKYKEQDLITQKKNMPIIMYENKTIHRYFPDIYIPNDNLIIEVKSNWTYKKDLIKNILKALATRKLGYNFETWIFNEKKELIII
jgi:uncharacterized protein YneR